jgi:hypothetical protein
MFSGQGILFFSAAAVAVAAGVRVRERHWHSLGTFGDTGTEREDPIIAPTLHKIL